MALVLTEEQNMLKDAAAGFLAEKATVAHQRELRDTGHPTGFDESVWREMAEMGWAGIAIPEEFGGAGYGYTGLGLVLEQAGKNLSPAPLQSTVMMAAPVIMELGSQAQKAQWLPRIASGEKLLSLALQEGAHHAPLNTALQARRHGDDYVLSGSKVLVQDVAAADAFIVVARTAGSAGEEGGLSAFVVDAGAEGLSVESRQMVDSRGSGNLQLNDVIVSAANLLGAEGDAWSGLSRALDIATIGLASELLGLSAEAFSRTIDYLKERKQFGKIIGTFQGLQHRAAEMFAELELCRSIVLQALHAIDDGDESLALHASAAKAKLCQIAQNVTNEAIQMHGGIGMTDEHEIGFFIKRARVAQHTLGDYNYHLDRFALLNGF